MPRRDGATAEGTRELSEKRKVMGIAGIGGTGGEEGEMTMGVHTTGIKEKSDARETTAGIEMEGEEETTRAAENMTRISAVATRVVREIASGGATGEIDATGTVARTKMILAIEQVAGRIRQIGPTGARIGIEVEMAVMAGVAAVRSTPVASGAEAGVGKGRVGPMVAGKEAEGSHKSVNLMDAIKM